MNRFKVEIRDNRKMIAEQFFHAGILNDLKVLVRENIIDPERWRQRAESAGNPKTLLYKSVL